MTCLQTGLAVFRFPGLGPFHFFGRQPDRGAVGQQQVCPVGRNGGDHGGFPGSIAAGKLDIPQRVCGVFIDRQHRQWPAPAMAAVIGEQAILEGLLGSQLEAGVDGGADREAALFERIFAIAADQLTAQLLNEIGCGGVFRAAQAAHGCQRLGAGLFHLLAGDIAILEHPVQHIVAPRQHAFGIGVGVHPAWKFRQRGKGCGLGEIQLGQRLVEIVERRRSHPV